MMGLRILTVGALIFLSAASGETQQKAAKTNPAAPCGHESAGLPGFYYEAVVARLTPPHFERSLISVAEGAEIKIVLMTDGEKFELWTDTPETSQKSVNEFLLDLNQSCRLPPDPADAAGLIKLKWESRPISAAQFEQAHSEFTSAISQYVSKAQARYEHLIEERMLTMHLDTLRYPIVYDNQHEHIELDVWNSADDPMVKWVRQLKKLAEDKFNRSFGSTEAGTR